MILFGDCRESMRSIIAQGTKVQMCVTSPPYFGLRDYGHDGQLGQESTPEEFIANLIDVFRLVRELLTDDGVLWLNIGDSYAGSGRGNNPNGKQGTNKGTAFNPDNSGFVPAGCKPKDLIGIPWMLAFALRADGWYLRQDIIWAKPNPMPESVTDRCTKSHEYIFLLSKSRKYYFDADAIKEPATTKEGRPSGIVRDRVYGYDSKQAALGRTRGGEETEELQTRNKRSVWTVNTKPYSGAHFATFPPALIEPCVLAGSRPNDTVFDPFMGSGTVADVAVRHGRQYLGCEINEAYKPLQDKRIADALTARGIMTL